MTIYSIYDRYWLLFLAVDRNIINYNHNAIGKSPGKNVLEKNNVNDKRRAFEYKSVNPTFVTEQKKV